MVAIEDLIEDELKEDLDEAALENKREKTKWGDKL